MMRVGWRLTVRDTRLTANNDKDHYHIDTRVIYPETDILKANQILVFPPHTHHIKPSFFFSPHFL